MAQSKLVLVTGATGQQGGAVVKALMTRGHHVRALTRNAASPAAQRLREQGVEIAGGDFTDHDSLVRAARGVDAMYAMSTPYETGYRARNRAGHDPHGGCQSGRSRSSHLQCGRQCQPRHRHSAF